MALARFERDFTDEAGNLLTGNVSVQVRRMTGGMPQLYSDREGASALGNPFINDGGRVAFHAEGNAYRVTVTQGAFSRELTYVALGLAGETDFTFARNQGEWDDAATYARGDYVIHEGFGLFISTQESNLNHEPDSTTPGSTEFWTYYPGVAGPPGEGLHYDVQVDELADRAAYNAEAEGFSVLVSDVGDGRAAIYVMGAGGSGDWGAASYITGADGQAGVDGKFSGAEVIKTSAYTAVAADVGKTFILNKATADTLSFDPAATLGATWMIMVKNIGAGTWSLDPSGAETIDGSATISLAENESIVVSSNGTALRSMFRGSSSGGALPTAGGDMTGPIGFIGPDAVLDDASAVAGSAEEFFYPDFFGNPATGIVHRLNRVLVGIAALTSSDTPPDTQDWLETLVGSTTRGAQLASISAIGNLGVLGAARTSDFRSWAGAASGGAQGVTGFGWNDDTVAGNPIAVGGEFRGFRKAGVVGITAGAQISAANEGTTVDITPSGGVVAGSTMALLLTNGPAPTDYDNPISAALVVGSGALSAVSRKGLIFLADALDTSLGGGAGGIAMEMARAQSIRWLNSSDAVDAEIWGNANGLNISGTARIGASLANYYTISGSASTQPVITVDGSATDIDLVLQAKGVGNPMLRKTDTQTNAVAIAAQLRHSLSSGTAAAGIGVGQNFVIVNASAVNKIIAEQDAVTTDATNGSEDADFVWKLMAAGAAAAEKLRLKSTGELNLATGGTVAVNGTKILGARKTGWAVPTGTLTRTTFVTSTVTLPQLAERVAALIADLEATSGHGVIGA